MITKINRSRLWIFFSNVCCTTGHMKWIRHSQKRFVLRIRQNFKLAHIYVFQKRIRLLLLYALGQQPDLGEDVSVASILPLLVHLRGPDTLVAYAVDPLALDCQSNSNLDPDRFMFALMEDATGSDRISLRAIKDVGFFDLTLDDTILLRAFIQEDHSIVFTLATQTLEGRMQLSTNWHAVTGSPRVRMFSRIAGQRNALGQIPVFQEHIQSNTFSLVSVYADRLTDYIEAATSYHKIMIVYRDLKVPPTPADHHYVLEAYLASANAKQALLWLDNSAGHDKWLYEGLREVRYPRVIPAQSILRSLESAIFIYFTNTSVFALICSLCFVIRISYAYARSI